jgi:large subunit ribosomal protein L29
MKASKIREMSLEEMQKKAVDLKEAYFNLRFQHETGQLENPVTLSQTRKDIARIKTIIKEKQV